MIFDISLIVQARLGSLRFPKKVCTSIRGRPLLYWVLSNLGIQARLHTFNYKYIVAVPDNEVSFFREMLDRHGLLPQWHIFGGCEGDVLGRFCAAIDAYPCDMVVRATGDNPFLRLNFVESAIDRWQQEGKQEYFYAIPEAIPHGTAVEVFSPSTLFALNNEEDDPYFREHVTLRLRSSYRDHSQQGNIVSLSIDTYDDLYRLNPLFNRLSQEISSYSSLSERIYNNIYGSPIYFSSDCNENICKTWPRPLVMVYMNFNSLSYKDICLLRFAAQHGSYLAVLLKQLDSSCDDERLVILSSLGVVDGVYVFDDSPDRLMDRLRPDILVIDKDKKGKAVNEDEFSLVNAVQEYHGHVCYYSFSKG